MELTSSTRLSTMVRALEVRSRSHSTRLPINGEVTMFNLVAHSVDLREGDLGILLRNVRSIGQQIFRGFSQDSEVSENSILQQRVAFEFRLRFAAGVVQDAFNSVYHVFDVIRGAK